MSEKSIWQQQNAINKELVKVLDELDDLNKQNRTDILNVEDHLLDEIQVVAKQVKYLTIASISLAVGLAALTIGIIW